MTLTQLNTILKATGYPVAYSHFSSPPTIPYITFLSAYSSNFQADNKNYHKIDNLQIELYTLKKDLVAEQTLEDLLDLNELVYESTETYIETEKIFQKIYEVRLI